MGYQALLFCPDEKLASVVSRLFSELDFTVEAVHDPFAAVKKLMALHYDAVVVDSEIEHNAALLFKSARNSGSNQSSLAIALVEGQAGVASAYRIGANLVLTKPINIEQAKGTLRVARGLLRKGSEAAGASAAAMSSFPPPSTAPVSAGFSFEPASRAAAAPPSPPGAVAPAASADKPVIAPALSSQSQITTAPEKAAEAHRPTSPNLVESKISDPEAIKTGIGNEIACIAPASEPAQKTSLPPNLVPGSAAAAAPAKTTTPEVKINRIIEADPAGTAPASPSSNILPFGFPSPATPSGVTQTQDAAPFPTISPLTISDAPSFAALGEEDSSGWGGKRKILIAAIVILALATLGYFGYSEFGKPGTISPPRPTSAPQDSEHAAPSQTVSVPSAAPSTTTLEGATSTAQTSAPKTEVVSSSGKSSTATGHSPMTRIAVNPPADIAAGPAPATRKPETTPLLVKSNAAPNTPAQPPVQTEDTAPPLPSTLALASPNDSHLSGLMPSASSSLPNLATATVKISQGVSQGLLIKRVQPRYPQAALAIHARGAVQIEATVNKEGHVTKPKVISGNPLLANAALEAVREWRYKPYYLDGQPVEIRTQITVN